MKILGLNVILQVWLCNAVSILSVFILRIAYRIDPSEILKNSKLDLQVEMITKWKDMSN